MIEVQVILDSISPEGHRLTTFKLRYPKFIHQDFLTHRRVSISSNSSSSRAVPTQKLIEEVMNPDTRARHVRWGKNQPGMQDAGDLSEGVQRHLEALWDTAAMNAAGVAAAMLKAKAHKQMVNRILDPFIHINTVCTATEYMNFFGLRRHSDTDPTLMALANLMWEHYKSSEPTPLKPGQWHLPYIDPQDIRSLPLEVMIRTSVARCARVSYESLTTGKVSTVAEDLELYNKLITSRPVHASPAENQATPDDQVMDHKTKTTRWRRPSQHGNFTGWCQYRKMIPNETIAPMIKEKA